jgi:biopolymer transport protein ExbD
MISPGEGSSGSRGRGTPGDFDINLAPIIDCFTVIIAFLLASAAFLSIGVFEAAVPSPGTAQGQQALANTSTLDVIATLKSGGDIELSWSGVKSGTLKVAGRDGANLSGVTEELKKLRDSVDASVPGSLELRAADGSSYSDIIRVLESAKPSFPAVILGGL